MGKSWLREKSFSFHFHVGQCEMLIIPFNTHTLELWHFLLNLCRAENACLEDKAQRESVKLQETGTHLGMSTSPESLIEDNKNRLTILTSYFFSCGNITELNTTRELSSFLRTLK